MKAFTTSTFVQYFCTGKPNPLKIVLISIKSCTILVLSHIKLFIRPVHDLYSRLTKCRLLIAKLRFWPQAKNSLIVQKLRKLFTKH